MKMKNILGAAAVAVAGLSTGQAIAAEPVGPKNRLETTAKTESGVHTLDVIGKGLFQEHMKQLTKIGADGLEILSSVDPQKLMSGTVSANGMTTITINFMKNGVKLPGYGATIMAMTSDVKNKYDMHELLTKSISDLLRKETNQTSISHGGISINASGGASVSVTGGGNKNLHVDSSSEGGRITINGKDVTPDGIGPGPMNVETRDGVLYINGKPVKK